MKTLGNEPNDILKPSNVLKYWNSDERDTNQIWNNKHGEKITDEYAKAFLK